MGGAGPSGWTALLQLDAVVSWLAALALLARSSTPPYWRRAAAGWAPALPAAYAVALVLR